MKITGHSAESIFDSIRDGIGKGRLPAGSVLPPVRELAEQLGVNRNTVAAAYKRLDAAGLASTGGRRGTVVRGLPPTIEDVSDDPILVGAIPDEDTAFIAAQNRVRAAADIGPAAPDWTEVLLRAEADQQLIKAKMITE